MKSRVCFFSTVPYHKLLSENYSIQDIRILQELNYEVIVVNKFSKIPLNCDLYFSWWASGSILPLIKSLIVNKPLICIAGGNEAMLYRDSISKKSYGYLSYSFFKKLAVKFVLKYSTKVIVVSEFMTKCVRYLGATNPIVVYNCVDTNIFHPIRDRSNHILSIFKLDESVIEIKRGYIFLESIKKVLTVFPNEQFVIIGKFGNAYLRVKNLIKTLNIENNITLLNEIPNQELINWIQNSKLYVQISDTETFGLAIVEAMSCEVPVLVSKRGAIPEIVGEHGLYVNHNSPESVANALIDFLQMDTVTKNDMSKNLRERVQKYFSFETRKNKLYQILKNI